MNKVYGQLGKFVDLEPFEKSINIVKSTFHGGNFKVLNVKTFLTKLKDYMNACDQRYFPIINAIWALRLIDNIINLPNLKLILKKQ